jgi:putative DNA primase/helicase
MSEGERRALHERMAAARAARDAEQAKIHAEARARAARLWARSAPAGNDHPYLVRKRVRAYGIRQLRGRLVIPLRDADGELHTLQFIDADGKKTLLTGGRKRGCYHAIGRPDRALCICEGYATGATIHEITGHATAVAFDAGNLEPVALALRGKFPRLALVICADNDIGTPGNPGMTAATAAALAVGGVVAMPNFPAAANV